MPGQRIVCGVFLYKALRLPLTMNSQSKATARANIALIKYWGKADSSMNIPAAGSISITLDALCSETVVFFKESLSADELSLDGESRPEYVPRISRFLDILRERADIKTRASVTSKNNFPLGAGLASSASGFAALAAAASAALRLEISPRELSIVARQGSGSAARSVFGGFVEMHADRSRDGEGSFAEPLLESSAWHLEVVIALTDRSEKAVGSRQGMNRSAATSPYYVAWLDASAKDLERGRDAILNRDFKTLADVAQSNCLKMHSVAMTTQPALMYWNGATVECIRAIQKLQQDGVPVFFTIDAGPQVKAVCEPSALQHVASTLRAVLGVKEVILSGLGAGVEWG